MPRRATRPFSAFSLERRAPLSHPRPYMRFRQGGHAFFLPRSYRTWPAGAFLDRTRHVGDPRTRNQVGHRVSVGRQLQVSTSELFQAICRCLGRVNGRQSVPEPRYYQKAMPAVVCRMSLIICIAGATFGVHLSLQGCRCCIVPHRTHTKMAPYARFLCSLFPLGILGPQSSETGVRTPPNTSSNTEPQKRPLHPPRVPP
ncbi:hypothetical protein EDB85DRAFT_1000085 [Lactarius pseudohatsudake]|nr:hypothetical protein EDB85DRAFT_1000085 [Lactarius pseudohatsudake]